jgi:hypothetical protein
MVGTYGIQFLFTGDESKQAHDLLAALREAFPPQNGGPLSASTILGGEYSVPITKTTFWVDYGDEVDRTAIEECINRIVYQHAPYTRSLHAHELEDGIEFDKPVRLTDRPDFAVYHPNGHPFRKMEGSA